MVALNAGAALYLAELAPDIAQGVATAGKLLESGAAWRRLEQLVALTSGF